MEISATVYAVAKDEELLKQVYEILDQKTFGLWMSIEVMEPCAVLPLDRTWYGFREDADMTNGPEDWLPCLGECAEVLRRNGAVIVEFTSPDHPDTYHEFAYTTSSGRSGSGTRLMPGMQGYTRATGSRDLETAMYELFSGRTGDERAALCRRRERKEAIRKEKGDFEITPDGVLKRYRGHDIHVVIPDGVREIGESAFVDLRDLERMIMECEEYDAPELEMLTIPDSVEKIGGYAFAYCQNLREVEMTDHVREIGDRAFEGCESLTEIRLPAGLAEIKEFTFFLCENLKSVTIPPSVAYIRKNPFDGCALTGVKLPEGLLSIGEAAFQGCDFRKVRIPKSVTEIGEDAFHKDTQFI